MQTLDRMGFCPFSSAEFVERGRGKVLLLGKRSKGLPEKFFKVGRPCLEANALDDLEYSPNSDVGEANAEDGGRSSNRPTKYTFWFHSEH